MNSSLKIYQVDAFTQGPFTGNPAAVCPLESWLPDDLLQQIAEENNLSETSFIVKEKEGYRIRWFTPATEVKLCGHATLASGYVFFNELGYTDDTLHLNCLSGGISVTKQDDLYRLDFPLDRLEQIVCPAAISEAIGIIPKESYKGESDYLIVLKDEAEVRSLNPDFSLMQKAKSRGVIVTARGSETNVVSRCFYPQAGINEDPATGSAQTTLGAYWPNILNDNSFSNCQLSQRKGHFSNKVKGDRIEISGKARLFMKGEIYL